MIDIILESEKKGPPTKQLNKLTNLDGTFITTSRQGVCWCCNKILSKGQ